MTPLKAPFVYFGGKSIIAPEVWKRFGNPASYIEPFCGSCAVLLARPTPPRREVVNDMDGFLANALRALAFNPDGVAQAADWNVSEVDIQAREAWLVPQRAELTDRLRGDPLYCDPLIAGWWIHGMCGYIGSGYCSGQGPWASVDGKLVKVANGDIERKLPHLGDKGRGINKQLPHLGSLGRGINARGVMIREWFKALQARLRGVSIACGDWTRVCGDAVLGLRTDGSAAGGMTPTAIFLDPPYSAEAGRADVYGATEDTSVAHAVREWAIEHGTNPHLRIALCGYGAAGNMQAEHDMPDDWECLRWKANGGYGGQMRKCGTKNINATRETVWFSPHCVGVEKQGVMI
jgi:hypothetical protein